MSNQTMLSFALGPDLTRDPSLVVDEQGSVSRDTGFASVAGFVNRLDSTEVDIDFSEFWVHPEKVVGAYVLLNDGHGFLSVNSAAITRVTVLTNNGQG